MSINVENLYVNYGKKNVIKDASFEIKDGEFACLIGPNGSGKSTIIKAISRCIKPLSGKVLLNGRDIYCLNTKEVAKKMAVLPQLKHIPMDITVKELVTYGRYPHRKFGKDIKNEDKDIISFALEKTGLNSMKERYVESLSGGERQRAWIAMALCQNPQILIMDEPTAYLDIQYQIEILELIKNLNKKLNMTILIAIHDLNQAARYADKILVVNEGTIWNEGTPGVIINKRLFNDVFHVDINIYKDEVNKCPYFIPKGKSKEII